MAFIKSVLTIFLLIVVFTSESLAQSGTCNGAEVFCGSNAYSFPTSTNTTAEPGACYSEPGCGAPWPTTCACLSSAPNPAWYFMQAGSTGNITITMTGMQTGEPGGPIDIDFICWGPFTSPTGACVAGLTCDKVVSCSYDGSNSETCIIPNAIQGEFYMLLITNFSNQPGQITFQQSNSGQPGAGTTNCNIVVDCSLLALSPNPTVCDAGTGTFTLNGTVEFTNPPTTGTLLIKDMTTVPPTQILLNPPFVSPLPYSIPNIPCDGLVHDLYATFSEASNPCELSTTYTAPVAPCPSGIVSGGGPVCNDGTSQGTISIAINGAPGPYNITYAIDGVNQPEITGYAGPLPFTITTNIPGTYTLVSISNGTCSGSPSGSATITLVDIPAPPVPASPEFFTCGSGTVTLTMNDLTGTVVNWYDVATGGTKLFTGNPFVTPVLAATTTYFAESETIIGGCKSTTRVAVIAEIRPVPSVSNSISSVAACSGATWSIPLTSLPPGASFSWTATCLPAGSVTGFVTPGNGNTISDPLLNTSAGAGVVTYLVTPLLSQCTGTPMPFNVTINPKPVPSFLQSMDSVCEGSTMVIYSTQTGMSGYLWTVSAGGTVTSGQGTNTVQVTWTTVGSGTDRWIEVNYTDLNGCTAESPTRMYVTVKPVPNVTVTPPTQSICSGTTALAGFSSTVPGTELNTVFNWTLSAAGTVTPNTLAGTGNVNQSFSSISTVIEPVTFQVMPVALGCSPATGTVYQVNVSPVPHHTTAAILPLCSGSFTNLQLISDVTGTQFTWTSAVISGSVTGNGSSAIPATMINDQLINTGNTDGIVRYSVIPQANGCDGPVSEYDVTVHPVPLLSNTPARKEICQDNLTGITLASNVPGALFTWTCTQLSGAVTGWSPAAVPSSIIDQALHLSIFTSDSVIYHLQPSANGCNGLPADYTVVVNPVPKVTNSPMHDSICSGTSPDIMLTATCAGTTFDWSGAAGTGNVTGFGSGTTPLIGEILTNHGTSTGSVVYTVIPKAGLCTGADTLYTVYVYPKPNLSTLPLNTSVCSGNSPNIQLFSDVAGTTFSWTATASSTNVTGFAAGSGNTISQSLTNSGNTTETVTYSITPRANGCNGDSYIYTVTVYPTPHLMNTPPAPVCSGTLINIPLLPDVSGGDFTWTASCTPAGAVNGFTPVQATGTTLINETLNNTSNVPAIVTYMITPHANGCQGPQTAFSITVNPVPQISCTSAQSICSGTAFSPVNLSSTVAGTDFSWSATCPVGSINPCPLAPGTFNPIPAVTLMNVTDLQQQVVYSVSSSYAGCPGTTATHTITVNPSPTVTNWPLTQTLCSGMSSSQVNLQSSVTGTTFSWTATAAGPVTGFATSGTDQIPVQSLFVPAGSQGTVTYHIIPSFTGGTSCPGAPADYIIAVNPLPTPSVSGQNLVCELQPGVKYNTPSVPGRSYTWTVTGATAVANENTSEVTVTWGPYTNSPGTLSVTETIDATGCSQTTSIYNVTLQRRPIPGLSGPVSVCEGSTGKVYQTEPGMSNYSWTVTGGTFTSGGGAGSSSATVTWNTAGPQSVEVNYYNSLNCPGFPAKVLPVTVHPLPDVTITEGPGPNCEGAPHTYSVPADPQCTYAWTINPSSMGVVSAGQGTANPTISWVSQGTAILEVTATNGSTTCIRAGTYSLDIRPKPQPSFVPCFDVVTTSTAKKIMLKGASPFIKGQGVFSGPRVILNAMTGLYEFDPQGAPAGSYPVTYSYTNNYGCSSVTPPVTINVQNPAFSCGGDLTDVRDGKVYPTATISGKCWMTRNLDYGTLLTGNPPANQSDNCIAEKYCSPADDNCSKYGGFYQWPELMDYAETPGTKGLCPPGWHLPSTAEWQNLIDFLIPGITAPDANAVVSPQLKDPYLTGGFRALFDGVYYSNNQWSFSSGALTSTFFWTSTPDGSEMAIARGLNNFTSSISTYNSHRANSFSIRCVKD